MSDTKKSGGSIPKRLSATRKDSSHDQHSTTINLSLNRSRVARDNDSNNTYTVTNATGSGRGGSASPQSHSLKNLRRMIGQHSTMMANTMHAKKIGATTSGASVLDFESLNLTRNTIASLLPHSKRISEYRQDSRAQKDSCQHKRGEGGVSNIGVQPQSANVKHKRSNRLKMTTMTPTNNSINFFQSKISQLYASSGVNGNNQSQMIGTPSHTQQQVFNQHHQQIISRHSKERNAFYPKKAVNKATSPSAHLHSPQKAMSMDRVQLQRQLSSLRNSKVLSSNSLQNSSHTLIVDQQSFTQQQQQQQEVQKQYNNRDSKRSSIIIQESSFKEQILQRLSNISIKFWKNQEDFDALLETLHDLAQSDNHYKPIFMQLQSIAEALRLRVLGESVTSTQNHIAIAKRLMLKGGFSPPKNSPEILSAQQIHLKNEDPTKIAALPQSNSREASSSSAVNKKKQNPSHHIPISSSDTNSHSTVTSPKHSSPTHCEQQLLSKGSAKSQVQSQQNIITQIKQKGKYLKMLMSSANSPTSHSEGNDPVDTQFQRNKVVSSKQQELQQLSSTKPEDSQAHITTMESYRHSLSLHEKIRMLQLKKLQGDDIQTQNTILSPQTLLSPQSPQEKPQLTVQMLKEEEEHEVPLEDTPLLDDHASDSGYLVDPQKPQFSPKTKQGTASDTRLNCSLIQSAFKKMQLPLDSIDSDNVATGFHQEFMQRFDEFSLSWRLQIQNNEKKIH